MFRVPLALSVAHTNLEGAHVHEASTALRTRAALWHALMEGDPDLSPASAGSLRLELSMVLRPTGVVSMLLTKADVASVSAEATRHLVADQGIPAGTAVTLAHGAMRVMAAANAVVLQGICRAVVSMRTSPSPEGGGDPVPITSMVLRLSLRSLADMGANDAMGTAWFRSSHANALVILQHRAILVDPAAPLPLPAVAEALRAALAPMHLPLVTHRVATWSPVADLSLCTLGTGVMALMVLANTARVQEEDSLSRLVSWVHSRQHWLLRALVTAIQGHMNPATPAP